MIPAYKVFFRTDATLPWLIGMLSLLWIGLSVFLVIQIFRVESKLTAVLVAGIFTTNITVASTAATYIHDFDCDMFALLCAVAAVYLWRGAGKKALPAGAACVAVVLGIYQSYLSVVIVLVMLACMTDVLDGRSFEEVFLQGLRAIGLILLGGMIYYVAMKLVLSISQIDLASGKYNSLDAALALTPQSLLSLIYYAYVDCLSRLINVYSPYPKVLMQFGTLMLATFIAVASILIFVKKRIRRKEILLFAGLTVLLPLGMNLTYVLVSGVVHDLMVYAVWLFYLLVLLVADRLAALNRMEDVPEKRSVCVWIRGFCVAIVGIILYGSVQWDNAMYLKKDLEQKAALSLWTRIVYEIETYDGYIPGDTPLVFVGTTELQNDVIPGFEQYRGVVGMSEAQVFGTDEDFRVRSYFQYVLNNPAYIPSGDKWNAMQTDPRVENMPCYPKTGSVNMIDETLVVKLGEVNK